MISEKILKGIPLEDIFVFDMHGHTGSMPNLRTCRNDSKGLIETLDRLGVNAICISPFEAICVDAKKGNEELLCDIKNNKGRIYGYYTPNPYYEDKEIESYFEKGTGILGVKIHFVQQKSLFSHEGYEPALEIANKKGLPVLVHTWGQGEVIQVKDIASRYKNAVFIIAHAGLIDDSRDVAIEIGKERENIFYDTAISFCREGNLEYLVSKVGADRVLYGSDMATFEGTTSFGRVGLSTLSETDKIKIYGENAKKLFGLNNIM